MAEIRFTEYAPGYREHLENSTLSGNTISKRKGQLRHFVKYSRENNLKIQTENVDQSVDKIRKYFEQPETSIHGVKVATIRDFLKYIKKQEDTQTRREIKNIKNELTLSELKEDYDPNEVGKLRRDKIEKKLLSDQEIEAAKQQADQKTELIIDLLMDTAARPGELAAMRPEDLNFETNGFHINQTWNDSENKVEDRPKHGSYRRVQISSENLERLKQYIEENVFEEDEYLFSYKNDIYRPIKKAYTDASIRLKDNGKTNVTPHWHRHNACSRLVQHPDNTTKKVQEYMGHKDYEQTKEYEHFDESQVVDVTLS